MGKVVNLAHFMKDTPLQQDREFIEFYLADIANDVFSSAGIDRTGENIVQFMQGFIDCLLSGVEVNAVIDKHCFIDYMKNVEEVEGIRVDKPRAYIMGYTYWLYYC